ncbi:MAG: glutamyl-tRNA reductase [Microcella sp.]
MLLCVTANHRNTPFELLERLSVDADALTAQVAAAHAAVRGAVGIATCNRVEVYLDIDAPDVLAREIASRSVADALDGVAGVGTSEALATAELLNDARAIHHLFSVSAGLESVAVGEEEIAGQIKRAAATARERGATSPALDRAFQQAIRTARAARAEGDASRTGRSLVRLSLDLVGSRLRSWEGVNVLLVGTGQYAATTVAALRERGADRIRVYSPTGRAQVFAARSDTEPTNELAPSLVWADVVITCTTRLSVTADDVPADARFFAIDLGLPRNIDPAVGELYGVTLLDLETLRMHAPLVHWSAEEDARIVVDSAAHEFTSHSQVTPAIVALREHVLSLVEDEIERARRRGDDGRTEEALRHLAGVLLHAPSTRARAHAARGDASVVSSAVEALFGIDVPSASGASCPHAIEQGEDGKAIGLRG